jgi:uncharacterized protein YkwD
MRSVPVLTLLVLLCAACSGSGSSDNILTPPGQWWPPETPRQRNRLHVISQSSDPQHWWVSNVYSLLPADTYDSALHADYAAQLARETNEVRRSHSLPPVQVDPLLNRVAQAHAMDQAIRDYWSHTTPEGLGSHLRLAAAGGPQVLAGGENSSANPIGLPPASQVVRSYEHHPGHRELLLHPEVTRIGVGVYRYAPNEMYHVVQLLMDFADS